MTEPFAYGIQAPIGSVTPLFHKLKDAEDYVAKLTDSRNDAKIIPLYQNTVNTERLEEITSDMPRWHKMPLIEQLRDGGTAMKNVPLFAVKAMRHAADEIDLLCEAIRRIAEQDATVSVRNGNVTVEMDATLTDAEREALGKACDLADYAGFHSTTRAVLRGLLEKHK